MKIQNPLMLTGLSGVVALLVSTGVSADCDGRCAAWEAVKEYNGNGNDLPKTVPEGEKFQAAIAKHSNTWITDFAWRNNSAWERDFKDVSLGGTDHNWADDVDLMLFAGHGNRDGFYFGVNQDDLQVHYNDARLGNKDLEWIIIDACQVLKNDSGKWNRWGWPVFKGLHYVFSYSTDTFDKDSRGEDFAKYAMKHGWRVKSSWVKATILSENGTTAAYMRADSAGTNTYDDHLWGFGYTSPDPTNPTTLYYASWSTN